MSTEQRKPQTIHPPLVEVALDTERHVAAAGWDQPVRLFALVETVRLLEAEPALAAQLDSQATPESGALSAIEQEDLPHHEPLETFLAQLAWPPEVDGAALAVERIVLPPAAMAAVEPTLPDDEQQAAAITATLGQVEGLVSARPTSLIAARHLCAVTRQARDHAPGRRARR